MLTEKDFEVIGKSFDKEIDMTLIDKYEETGDRAYIEEWLQSPHAAAMAVHILRFTTSRGPMTKLVENTRSRGILDGVYKPNLLSDVYIQMTKVANSYKSGRGASFSTYLFRYVPAQLARVIGDEHNEMNNFHQPIYIDGEDGEEFGLIATEEYYEDYYAEERKKVVESLFDVCDSEEDRFVLKSILEEKTYSEMAEELGRTSQAVHQRRDKIFNKIKRGKGYAKEYI